MNAIVIGGTGATGKELVKQLLDDSRFKEVTVLVRRPYFGSHIKLKEIIVNFARLQDHEEVIQGDVAFSCLGTTLKDAGGKDEQWEVDFDYQLHFAAVAKENGIKNFVLLSAAGADSNSPIFYNKMKGSLEDSMRSLQFNQLLILRPGAIDRPNSTRIGEKLLLKVIRGLNKMGFLESYSALPAARVAQAMIAAFFTYMQMYKIVTLEEMKNITKLRR